MYIIIIKYYFRALRKNIHILFTTILALKFIKLRGRSTHDHLLKFAAEILESLKFRFTYLKPIGLPSHSLEENI